MAFALSITEKTGYGAKTLTVSEKRMAGIAPFVDSFTRADGVLSNGWAGATWAIVSGAAVNTPTLGSDLVVNGGFDADSDWTKGTGWSIADGVASHEAGTSSALTQPGYTVGAWYQLVFALTAFTAGSGINISGLNTQEFKTALATYAYTGRATAAALGVRVQSAAVLSVDDVSLKALTLASLFATRDIETPNVNAAVHITRASGRQAGLVLCLDSATAPANFLLAYIDGAGYAKLDKCVAGVYSSVISGAATYVAGATLRAVKNGTSVSLYYNGTQIGTTQTVSDAGVIYNTQHGLFSTASGNSLDDLSLTQVFSVPTLTLASTVAVPAPDIYGAGVAVGVLGGASRVVFGSGTSLLVEPTFGTVTCVDAAGNTVWTYNSPSDDFAMGLDIGDVDGDGANEVAVGFRLQDHMGVLLDGAGQLVWSYDLGAEHYCRVARIGEVRSDYAGQEVLFGGAAGVLVLLDQAGNLIWQASLTDTNYRTVQSAWIADTDGDGANEILIACGESIRKHQASDGAEVWATVIGGLDDYCFGVVAGKVTADAGLQVVGCSQFGGVYVFDQDGAVLWQAPGGPGGEQYSVALTDVDGDGYQEVFVGHGNASLGGVMLYDNDGHALSWLALPKAVKFMALGDLDGDGAVELVTTCDDGIVYIIDVG